MVDQGGPQARLVQCETCEEVLSVMINDGDIGKHNGECRCENPDLRLLDTTDFAELE